MWPFAKKHPKPQFPGLPGDWREVLAHCDFQLAKSEIADLFAASNREAAASGQQAMYNKEFVAAWQKFAQHPNYQNAIGLIESAQGSPALWSYFAECCPGGRFVAYKSLLGGRTSKSTNEERA